MKVHCADSIHQRTSIGTSLLLIALSLGSVWWTWQVLTPTRMVKTSTTVSPQTVTDITPTKPPTNLTPLSINTRSPETYWLQVNGQKVSLVPQRIALNPDSPLEQAIAVGIVNLLANSKPNTQSSAVPDGTRLLSLKVAPEGIYIDLSREFSQGGGSSSMMYRVAQVLYTTTSLNPSAKVYLSVEGKALDENYPLGGEGIMLNYPLTRQQLREMLPLD